MNRDDKITKGLQRATQAEQARQQSGQRIENNRRQSLDQTIGMDARLQVFGTQLRQSDIEAAYTQQPPSNQ